VGSGLPAEVKKMCFRCFHDIESRYQGRFPHDFDLGCFMSPGPVGEGTAESMGRANELYGEVLSYELRAACKAWL
jgi:hypothetical protein